MSNLNLFVLKSPGKNRQSHKVYVQDSLEKLEIPLNRVLHNIFDNLLNIDMLVENLKSSRYLRLQTRIKKLKKIFIEIFPTIEISLSNLKSLKQKQIK